MSNLKTLQRFVLTVISALYFITVGHASTNIDFQKALSATDRIVYGKVMAIDTYEDKASGTPYTEISLITPRENVISILHIGGTKILNSKGGKTAFKFYKFGFFPSATVGERLILLISDKENGTYPIVAGEQGIFRIGDEDEVYGNSGHPVTGVVNGRPVFYTGNDISLIEEQRTGDSHTRIYGLNEAVTTLQDMKVRFTHLGEGKQLNVNRFLDAIQSTKIDFSNTMIPINANDRDFIKTIENGIPVEAIEK